MWLRSLPVPFSFTHWAFSSFPISAPNILRLVGSLSSHVFCGFPFVSSLSKGDSRSCIRIFFLSFHEFLRAPPVSGVALFSLKNYRSSSGCPFPTDSLVLFQLALPSYPHVSQFSVSPQSPLAGGRVFLSISAVRVTKRFLAPLYTPRTFPSPTPRYWASSRFPFFL